MVEEVASSTTLLKPHANGVATLKSSEEPAPPDGGAGAWLVMIGSFFCNGIIFGVINSYSVLYAEFHDILKQKGSSSPSGQAALIGSLAIGTTFLVSAVAGVLTDYIGLRRTAFLGGLIASGGMFLSSFCVHNHVALCVTFGVMYGLGGALSYTPSLAVLGHYFKKHLCVVNGVVTAGSSLFSIAMPYVIAALLKNFRIAWTLRFLALIASFLMIAAFFFKPVKQIGSVTKKVKLGDAFNTSLWKNRKYTIWIAVIACSLTGYFVPFVYMTKFIDKSFEGKVDNKLPLLCIGIMSGVGRVVFGHIADRPKVSRILLQQIAFFSIGVLTMLLPLATSSFDWVIVITLGMGLFDGCFIALLGPIAFDICGKDGANQAIGFLLGACSIPLTVGPYVAGVIYEEQKSYTLPLILAGIPPTVGSLALFATKCVRKQGPQADPAASPLKISNGTCNTKESKDGHEEEGPY